ncbi:MAG: radical SAM protein [Methanothrix sp.]|nr:radical SAM protein [Methanothrix sp.]
MKPLLSFEDDLTVPPPGLVSVPNTVEISITGRCNLSCRYCFYAHEMAALKDLPKARWLSFFEEMGSLGVQRVIISGGEAFTRQDIFELIDCLIENKMRYSMLTNGTLITEETIEAFGVGKRRMRLDSIQFSIDGSCAEVHDASRPPSSFDRAMRGLRLMKERGFPLAVRVTVNRYNLHDLENIARLLLEDVGLASFGTNEADRFGSAKCYGQDVMLTPEERLLAMRTLSGLAKRYLGRIAAFAGPLAMAKMVEDIDRSLSRGETGRPGRGTLCSCGGALQKLAVLHDGTIVPCNLLPDFKMGEIGKTPLLQAWQHGQAINALRKRRSIPLSSLPECRGCNYTGFCAGGCPAVVYAKMGRLDAIDPGVCYRQFKEIDHVAL